MFARCNLCLLPNTKPDLRFDEAGTCSACTAYARRESVDWASRQEEFIGLVRELGESRTPYNCIVPVSGGKDSSYQVLKMKSLGLNPLAVTSQTCDLTPIGRRNIDNLRSFGVDHINVAPEPGLRAQLNRLGLETVGDISWPEHVGIFSIPVRVATWLGITLIVWGENSQNEYGGPEAAQDNSRLDRSWLEEFGGLIGLRVSDLPALTGRPRDDFWLYEYPEQEAIEALGVKGLFLGHFFEWDGLHNALVSQSHGFETFGRAIEGSFVDYENLDNFQTGIHDYFKFLKFGFGRATDIASLHVRRGRIDRSTALRIVEEREGVFPSTYLGKRIEDILEPLGLSTQEFRQICDRFTNLDLFEVDDSGRPARDARGNLVRRD